MFDFRDFLEVSKSIETSENINDEAYRRTAVSRAYYCAYNVVKDYVNSTSSVPIDTENAGKGGHGYFWKFIGATSQIKELNQIEDNGLRLLADRKKADYDSKGNVSKFMLKQCNLNAKDIINQIDKKMNKNK